MHTCPVEPKSHLNCFEHTVLSFSFSSGLTTAVSFTSTLPISPPALPVGGPAGAVDVFTFGFALVVGAELLGAAEG